MQEADAWFSGDVDRLRNFYGTTGTGTSSHLPGFAGGAPGKVRFWPRRAADRAPNRTQIHVPIAADIASTSADLLFSEQLRFPIPGAADGGNRAASVTQDRLDVLVDEGGILTSLIEAAEVCSALGGVYIRAVWDDRDRLPMPTLTVVHADAAFPEWRWGRLSTVTFWTVLLDENGKVWRHLERHEPGVILHGLYVGERDTLGKREAMSAHPHTEALLDGDDRTYDESTKILTVELPDSLRNELTVRYVPNVRPNRRHRHTLHGRSDYDGTYSLMDALDETWSSWMRDLRLGQARVVVSQDALTPKGRGKGATLDIDQEVFTGLDMEPTVDGKPMIEQIQFAIRTKDHADTAFALVERIVSTAGYSPQSFGLHIEGRAESGSALRIREGKTLRTGGRKQRYWTPETVDLLEVLLVLDRDVYGSPVEPDRPAIRWGDSLVDDPQEQATTVEMLRRAQAASIRTRVQMVQPELEGQALEDEVARIQAEEGVTVTDPTGFGD
ncbi:capsid protein [Egicoccus sp. AB-alg2]